MASKKKSRNAFAVYMTETQQKLAKQGIVMKMADMPSYCTKDWEKMSKELKETYRTKGKIIKTEVPIIKYTSTGEKVEDIKKQSNESKSQTEAMYSYIEELVRVHPASSHYLPKQKFILIHINPYACENEGFYFPAEITMAEFSLEKGLIRSFHQLIGFDKKRTNAPPAPTADINNHAKNHHLINTYSMLPSNYTGILLKIIGFIIEKKVTEAVLKDSDLDMPPIFTAHSSSRNELMITSSSLYQLYQSSVVDARKEDFNSFLKVYHLDKLLMEIKNISYSIMYPDADEKAIPSVAMATDYLSKDMLNTVKSIGCGFHDELEVAHVCSNYYICKWIYIVSTHCCQYFNVKLVSGCHYDFDLSKQDVEDVVDNEKVLNSSPIEKSHPLTIINFPAFEEGSSTMVTERPVWSKTVIRSDCEVSTPNKTICLSTLNENTNFPPLDSLHSYILENTPATEMNVWPSRANRSKTQ